MGARAVAYAKPPKHLGKAARSKRRRLARVQEALGARAWITECDLASFAVYCTAFERWIAAVDNWRDHGIRFDDIAILNVSNIKDVYRSNRDYWNGKMASAILRAKKKGKFVLDVDVSDRRQTNRRFLMDEIDKLPIKIKRYRQS